MSGVLYLIKYLEYIAVSNIIMEFLPFFLRINLLSISEINKINL